MLTACLALLLQSATISGSILPPGGGTFTQPVQVALLPNEFAQIFNARAQMLIDDYWELYKPEFSENKELFYRATVSAQREALDYTIVRMQMGSKNGGSMVKSAPGGQFEFRNVAPGWYKVVAIGTVGRTDYVWTASVDIAGSKTVFLQLKNHTP